MATLTAGDKQQPQEHLSTRKGKGDPGLQEQDGDKGACQQRGQTEKSWSSPGCREELSMDGVGSVKCDWEEPSWELVASV